MGEVVAVEDSEGETVWVGDRVEEKEATEGVESAVEDWLGGALMEGVGRVEKDREGRGVGVEVATGVLDLVVRVLPCKKRTILAVKCELPAKPL